MLHIISSENTVIASFKSRHGNYRVTLENPSIKHLQRLNSKGFVITVKIMNGTVLVREFILDY